MQVSQIKLENFRNYSAESFDFSENINVITGANAQGKTNLLEAIYILTGSKSFRTRFDRELIKFGGCSAKITADISAMGRKQSMEIVLEAGKRRKILKNGVKKRACDLQGELNAVIFSPEDLSIVRDGAAVRRKFIDNAMVQLRPKYCEYLARYNKLYEHKSKILKEYEQYPDMLKALDDFSEAMAMCSAHIIRYRASFVSRLSQRAQEIHHDFSGEAENLQIKYKTIKTVSNAMLSAQEIFEEILIHQKMHKNAELHSRSCLTGIHRDELDISINNIPARQFASQGQTRTVALSLKLAERLIFLDETGYEPILLLDDVLSELDSKRQAFVLNRIGGGQTFITCCEDEDIAKRTGGRIICIDDGKVK